MNRLTITENNFIHALINIKIINHEQHIHHDGKMTIAYSSFQNKKKIAKLMNININIKQ